MNSDIVKVIASVDARLVPPDGAAVNLGEVKEFGGIVQQAQEQGVPISAVDSASYQREEAWEAFSTIAERVTEAISTWSAEEAAVTG